VANLLVYIEPLADTAGPGVGAVNGVGAVPGVGAVNGVGAVPGVGALPGAIQALSEGRRLASALGARVHAFVPLARPDADGLEPGPAHAQRHVADDSPALQALLTDLSQHGADHVLLAPVPAGPPLWVTHGAALVAACRKLQPLLVLVPSTAAGRDLAPRLAARLEAAYFAEPILIGAGAEVLLSRHVYGPGFARRVALEELDRPCVVTLAAGRHRLAFGDDDAEVTTLDRAATAAPGCELLNSEVAPGAALDAARVVVTAGAGIGNAESLALVRALAEALGGELGATRSLCERGLVPGERAIDIGARRVAPALYVACAASGSVAHLGAVSPESAIVAINADPDAPVFRSARYGMVGTVEDVIPALLAALERRAQSAVPA
jgi:electron transfer flavoprotein alpha subunit